MEYKALAFLEEVAATIELSFDDTDGTLDVVMKNSDGAQVASGSVTVNAWKAPVIAATATVDGGTGTPSVEVVKSGTADNMTFTFKFHNLKGADGQDAIVTRKYIHLIRLYSLSGNQWDVHCVYPSSRASSYTYATLASDLYADGINSVNSALAATGERVALSDVQSCIYSTDGTTLKSGAITIDDTGLTISDLVLAV